MKAQSFDHFKKLLGSHHVQKIDVYMKKEFPWQLIAGNFLLKTEYVAISATHEQIIWCETQSTTMHECLFKRSKLIDEQFRVVDDRVDSMLWLHPAIGVVIHTPDGEVMDVLELKWKIRELEQV